MAITRHFQFLLLLPALAIFAGLCWYLDFTQDDAYISYRYAQNYLDGNGLVWNVGERVEGFTNFGWVTLLILWGSLGLNYILISKLAGVSFGLGSIVITWLISTKLLEGRAGWLSYLAPYLMACNFAVAYWSPAGLETAAFVFLALLSVCLYLGRSRFLIATLALAVWFRPEGAVVAGLLIVVDSLLSRRWFSFAFRSALFALVLSIPFVAFKLWYFGSVFPNPFYAKTGFSIDQVINGLIYAKDFLQHYGFLGIPLLLVAIRHRQQSEPTRVVWLFVVGYTLYVIAVGGDVLPFHRFFLPVAGLYAALMTVAVGQLSAIKPARFRNAAIGAIVVVAIGLTIWLPWKTAHHFYRYEIILTTKMELLAQRMKDYDSRRFSAATTTIGIFGYSLMGHTVIDMLGLTDSTIARHPQDRIAGMRSSWREANYNAPYLLGRKPDYIVFSTGMKPSAPAERALMLYPQFLSAYRHYVWTEEQPEVDREGITSASLLVSAFKRQRDFLPPFEITFPLTWVEQFKRAQEINRNGDPEEAARLLDSIRANPNSPKYPEMLYFQSLVLSRIGREEWAVSLLDTILAIDSLAEGPHKTRYTIDVINENWAQAAVHRRFLEEHSPWSLQRLDANIRRIQEQQNRR